MERVRRIEVSDLSDDEPDAAALSIARDSTPKGKKEESLFRLSLAADLRDLRIPA